MGYAGKVLVGSFICIGALAAVPFTGGGSVLAGYTLAASLAGASGIAAAGILAGGTAGVVAQKLEDTSNDKIIRNAKVSAFKDGIYEGKLETINEIMKFADFYLATTALSYYFARCDGDISEEELLEIEFDLNAIIKNIDIPDPIRKKLAAISSDVDLTFEDVKVYLDKVSLETLRLLEKDADEIIIASGGITEDEKNAKEIFTEYLQGRENE